MEHSHSSHADWQALYEAAMLEADVDKLPELITVARSAILDRIEESLTHPVPGEQRAMNYALRMLQRLAQTSNRRSAA